MNALFIASLDLRDHPLKTAKKKIRAEYALALSYLVSEVVIQAEEKRYTSERLKMYQNVLLPGAEVNTLFPIRNGISCIRKLRRKKLRYLLAYDVSLILPDGVSTMQAVSIINSCLSTRNQIDVDRMAAILSGKIDIDKKLLFVAPLIVQYRMNQAFLSQPERRIIITANTSAGKSTLINALIGKPLARTSQEVCTGNVCYFFNKAFEDNNVHLSTKALTLNATADELHNYEWSEPVSIASYFTQCTSQMSRLCFIDTPGVDAALYKNHMDVTHTALQNERYDMILYVVCPTRLGTDAEIKHLKWVLKNLPTKKVIFVLNKLDNYRDGSDSIEESVQGLKEELIKLGFENPIICPVSAYFSYLLKLKMTGKRLADDETDEYVHLSKKFMRPSYDLSRYYVNVQSEGGDSAEMKLSKRAGIYGLEKIIYGG